MPRTIRLISSPVFPRRVMGTASRGVFPLPSALPFPPAGAERALPAAFVLVLGAFPPAGTGGALSAAFVLVLGVFPLAGAERALSAAFVLVSPSVSPAGVERAGSAVMRSPWHRAL